MRSPTWALLVFEFVLLLAALKDQSDERAEQNAIEGGCPVCGIDADKLEADVAAREAVINAKTGAREAEAGAAVAAEIANGQEAAARAGRLMSMVTLIFVKLNLLLSRRFSSLKR